MSYESVAEAVAKRHATASGTRVPELKRVPFDDYRGSKEMGGWWISLDEAKANGMGEEWWKETEEPGSEPVAIPWASQKSKTNNKKKKKRAKSKPSDQPIWMYENGTMYLGPWTDVRSGAGGRITWAENGKGVKCNVNGSCYVGEFGNGDFHGWGRSFWLKNSSVWKNNLNKDERQITQTRLVVTGNGNGEETKEEKVGLPYEYKGKFVRNAKQCLCGTVTLKDGTKKVGTWSYDIAVKSDSFLCSGWSSIVEQNAADWWEDHSDGDSVELDTPEARKRGRQKEPSKLRGSFNSTGASCARISDESKQERRDKTNSNFAAPRRKVRKVNGIATIDNMEQEEFYEKGNNDNKGNNTNGDSDQNNENKSLERKDNLTTNASSHQAIGMNIIVPDEAPSSAQIPDTSARSNAADDNNTNGYGQPGMYPDAYLSETEERDLPLHTTIKFGNFEFFEVELEKIHNQTSRQKIDTTDSRGRTALDLAALTGQLDFVERLRSIEGSEFVFKSGPRMMIIAQKRSEQVAAYLDQVIKDIT